MKVILTKDVAGLGRAGDVKEVSDGHARNFLLPKHLVLPATAAALDRLQKEEQELQAKVKRQEEKFLSLKNKMESKVFTIKGRAQKQNLFAALHEDQVAKAINEKLDLGLTPDQVVIEKPIKSLGLHKVQIRFAEKLKADVKLDVVAES
ncbi:MAG: 50S ribosomal protein L9 [Candidatus Doudnabacteria bacterium]